MPKKKIETVEIPEKKREKTKNIKKLPKIPKANKTHTHRENIRGDCVKEKARQRTRSSTQYSDTLIDCTKTNSFFSLITSHLSFTGDDGTKMNLDSFLDNRGAIPRPIRPLCWGPLNPRCSSFTVSPYSHFHARTTHYPSPVPPLQYVLYVERETEN